MARRLTYPSVVATAIRLGYNQQQTIDYVRDNKAKITINDSFPTNKTIVFEYKKQKSGLNPSFGKTHQANYVINFAKEKTLQKIKYRIVHFLSTYGYANRTSISKNVQGGSEYIKYCIDEMLREKYLIEKGRYIYLEIF